jgi:hypothetical protein
MELTTAEKAYIAGIIDGEGHVGIQSVKDGFYLKIVISNSSKALIDWLLERLPNKYVQKREAGHSTNTKDIYNLHISGKDAQELLSQIQEYLVIKKEQCAIALQFPIVGRSMSDDQKLSQAMCYIAIRKLTERGHVEEVV